MVMTLKDNPCTAVRRWVISPDRKKSRLPCHWSLELSVTVAKGIPRMIAKRRKGKGRENKNVEKERATGREGRRKRIITTAAKPRKGHEGEHKAAPSSSVH